ncbi:MAG: hypothetical protein H0T61_05025, partial [Actinobacteria bacterium]|nr:hypothetical protein [Actinomycetota bacterium]
GLDALELIAAGASSVALGTILFSEPEAPARIRAELAAEAASRHLAHPLAAHRMALRSLPRLVAEAGNGFEKRLQIGEKHSA